MVFKPTMRLFKEPLLHFALIGAAFFGLYSYVSRPPAAAGIDLSAAAVEDFKTAFSNSWDRVPDAEELREVIGEYIREELAVREGRALGLDRNDPVIRQRIRQKLELMVEEQSVVRAPTDAELEAYRQEHAELFQDENGALPGLADIRSLVIFEWENQHRLEALDAFYAGLEAKYGVRVEGR